MACLLYKGSRFFKASGDREESITCKSLLPEIHARALYQSKGNDAHHIGHDHVGGFFTHLGKECHACLDASLWRRFFGLRVYGTLATMMGKASPEEPPRNIVELSHVDGERAIPYSPSLSFGRETSPAWGYWEHVSMASMAVHEGSFFTVVPHENKPQAEAESNSPNPSRFISSPAKATGKAPDG